MSEVANSLPRVRPIKKAALAPAIVPQTYRKPQYGPNMAAPKVANKVPGQKRQTPMA